MNALQAIRQEKIFVISAPSGTGKTTLNRRLIQKHKNVEISISLTTRPPRPNERPGDHYHFVSRQEFEQHIAAGEMLETADVHGQWYGTSCLEIKKIVDRGRIPILEIDVQGWQSVRNKLENATSIFVVPPHVEALWKRQESRGTDTLEQRWKRFKNARMEIAAGPTYDHFIINEDLGIAFNQLESLVIYGKNISIGDAEGRAFCNQLLAEFDRSAWIADLRQKLG